MKAITRSISTVLIAAAGLFMVAAPSAAQANIHHRTVSHSARRAPVQQQPRRQCIPLPQLGTPITSVPQDMREYCEAPWIRPETVAYSCEPRLTALNAYGQCHFECGPQHDNGAYANNCSNYCLARICQYGR